MEIPALSTKGWRNVGIAAACIAGLGLVLWLVSVQESCSFRRGVESDKQAIKDKLVEAENLEQQAANLQLQAAEKRGEIKRDTENLANAVNATDAAREETNRALANYENMRNTKHANTTEADLLEKLDKLK
jgi:F0F1-type ATP synthase membrane subunit b/b'